MKYSVTEILSVMKPSLVYHVLIVIFFSQHSASESAVWPSLVPVLTFKSLRHTCDAFSILALATGFLDTYCSWNLLSGGVAIVLYSICKR